MPDGLNRRFDVTAYLPSLVELGHVHLIAIGGSGMSAVARLLLAAGVPVSGSDAKASPVLAALRHAGATVAIGHDPAHVTGADTVVLSSAIPQDNPELVAARSLGLRVLHRSQALAILAGGHRAIAVAGANGKTTTSAMTTVALAAAGLDPSFAIGADLPGWAGNAHAGLGTAFVIEADESDGSFLAYRPEIAVVTNVQPDHLDFYGTFERVQAAYVAFAASVRPDGLVVACADDPGSAELAAKLSRDGRRVLTFGFAQGSDVRLSEATEAMSTATGFGAHARLSYARRSGELTLAVPGRHNLLDAAAAFAVAVMGFGADPERVLAGLARFGGARRRFEIVGRARGITVIDDYAHNPGKVAALVSTTVALVGADAVRVIFQPHLYSRTRDFAAQFAEALAPAGQVTLAPIYGARETAMPGVSSELIADQLRQRSPQTSVSVASSLDAVVDPVVASARPGDVILTVGAGDVTTLAPRLVAALDDR